MWCGKTGIWYKEKEMFVSMCVGAQVCVCVYRGEREIQCTCVSGCE